MVKPRYLQAGDTIGVVSPSFPALGLFPHRKGQAMSNLERQLGLKVRLSRHASDISGWVSAPAEERAQDVHEMFLASDIDAIIGGIGGDHSCQLLPYMDWELIKQHPKIFVGWSDLAVLCLAIWTMTGLVTFYGPLLATALGAYPAIFPYTVTSMHKALFRTEPMGRIEPAQEWTDEYLDWSQQMDQTRPRQMVANQGPVWIRSGRREGTLLGGCLESIDHLRGTRYFPDFHGSLFFWELSEDSPSPSRVDAILSDYENMGILESLGGMLVGRPYRYSDEDTKVLYEVIYERTKRWGFPVLAGLDFGHTDPTMTIPIGVKARMDDLGWTIIEPGVAGR